jgi:hypothetical protein
VQEVELSYRYKLHENYLENARKYIANVYVAINIALTELSDSYKKFRPHINLDESTAPEEVATVFLSSCKKFVEKIDDVLTRGADALLTNQLDEKLRRWLMPLLPARSAFCQRRPERRTPKRAPPEPEG